MLSTFPRLCLSLLALAALGVPVRAQQPAPTPPGPPAQVPTLPPAPALTVVAATVNGQNIPEIAVYRALSRIPTKNWTEARPEVINFLIENALIDQYLEQLKIPLDPKEVEMRFKQVKDELVKEGQDYEKLLKMLHLTEAELREQIMGAMRWDKFIDQQAPEKVLRDMFEKNKNMFDGSVVRARHVLLSPDPKDAKAVEVAKARLVAIKQLVETEGAKELAKVPPGADNLAREKVRIKAVDEAFVAVAGKESTCPSKAQGGDLGWFPRVGRMVEPFARVAFDLKLYQMAGPVATEFGYHLILVTDQKPGKDVKFEDVREMVKDVYSERLREAVLARMRPGARIAINAAPKY